MRYSKRYIVLTVILLVTFLAKLNTWNDEYADVTAFRGAKLQDEVFYPLKARSINEEGNLYLTVGEDTYGVADGIIMGDHMQVMASLSFVEDFFGCSASLYEDKKILMVTALIPFISTVWMPSGMTRRSLWMSCRSCMRSRHIFLCRICAVSLAVPIVMMRPIIRRRSRVICKKEAFRHPMICGRKIVCPLCATRAILRPAGRRQHFLPWNPLFCRKKSFPLMQTL